MQISGYRDLTVLGRGGFSTVYRALQESVQRDVALKVLAVHMAGADAKARFNRECATNGRVGTHPNIVTLFDSGFADDGSPYLAMQLCSGGSLSERMRATGPLPIADVLRIGVKISAALQYAHSAGVLHRDIKPENIMISDFGEPELADFGISSVDDQRLSTVTASSFTINHAAPEALAGEPSSVATDLYSLCSTLFTLVAGHTPFTAPSSTAVVALVNMVMNDPAPATGRPDVPASLEHLLAKGLSKNPADRPVDAKAIGSALQQIQQEMGLPVTEFPSAPPPTAYSSTQVVAGGVAGGIAGGIAGVGGIVGVDDTGALPPTGAMPATGAMQPTGAMPPTGALPPTGAMPPTGGLPEAGERRPTIDTGARPLMGVRGVPFAAQPTGPAPGNPTAPPGSAPPADAGAWGAWASDVGADQPGPVDDGHYNPVVAAAVVPARIGPTANGSSARNKPDRRAWWIIGAVLAVLIVAAGVYFIAIHKSSQAANPPAPVTAPVSSGRTRAGSSPAPSVAVKTTPGSSTSSPTPTTRSSTTAPTTAPTTAATVAVIQSFGSTRYPDGGAVDCANSTSSVDIPMVWSTTGATHAWIAIDAKNLDASQSAYDSNAPTAAGTGQGRNYSLPFTCSAAQHVFTLTVANADGTKTSRSMTLLAKIAVITTPATSTPQTSTTPTTTSPTSSSSSTAPATPTTPSTTAAPTTSSAITTSPKSSAARTGTS